MESSALFNALAEGTYQLWCGAQRSGTQGIQPYVTGACEEGVNLNLGNFSFAWNTLLFTWVVLLVHSLLSACLWMKPVRRVLLVAVSIIVAFLFLQYALLRAADQHATRDDHRIVVGEQDTSSKPVIHNVRPKETLIVLPQTTTTDGEGNRRVMADPRHPITDNWREGLFGEKIDGGIFLILFLPP